MKKIILILIALVAMLSLQAQKRDPEEMTNKQMIRLIEELELSKDQQSQIRPLINERTIYMQDNLPSKEESRYSKMKKIKKIKSKMKKIDKTICSYLSKSQVKKYKKMQEEQREKMKNRKKESGKY